MTTLSDLRAYCNSRYGAAEDFPFDATTLVFKVRGKIFAILPLDQDADAPDISLKCEPTLAVMLRDTHPGVRPGYHLNKRHWNTVTVDGSIPEPEVMEMIDHSYAEVVKTLPKKVQESLQFKA